jgi:hypothetical protein
MHLVCNAIVTHNAVPTQMEFTSWAFGHTIFFGDLGMLKTETLNLRVSADFKKRLTEEAAKETRSVTNYLEATLLAHWERTDALDRKEKGKKKGRNCAHSR